MFYQYLLFSENELVRLLILSHARREGEMFGGRVSSGGGCSGGNKLGGNTSNTRRKVLFTQNFFFILFIECFPLSFRSQIIIYCI